MDLSQLQLQTIRVGYSSAGRFLFPKPAEVKQPESKEAPVKAEDDVADMATDSDQEPVGTKRKQRTKEAVKPVAKQKKQKTSA